MSDWVRQLLEVEDDDAKREEVESSASKNLEEDFWVRMGALPGWVGSWTCWCLGPPGGVCRQPPQPLLIVDHPHRLWCTRNMCRGA